MFPRPVVVGLSLCDNAIIERDTNKVSLVGQFRQLRYAEFPAAAIPFWAAATVTGGVGRGLLRLEIQDLESLDPLITLGRSIELADRLAEYHLLIRIKSCTFPSAGWYNCQLVVDDELIGQRRFHVVQSS